MKALLYLEQLGASWVTPAQWTDKEPFEVLGIVEGLEDTKKAQERREILPKFRDRRKEEVD